ncbi:MAG: hypothetical protein IJC71_00740 [Clostridia bacterium]|nr:hypothetical protein [Clostridia bacterium]
MNTFRIEAHRGVGTTHPENTLPAFEAAVREGYDMIELDLKFTRDDRCVALHDRTIRRTARHTDGTAADDTAVSDLPFSEARSYDYGLWKGEAFRGTVLPAWEEILAFAKENRIPLKIDNCYERFTDEQREILYRCIEEADAGALVGFTCKNVQSFAEVADRFPLAEFHYDGLIADDTFDKLRAIAGRHRTTVWIPTDSPATAWVSPEIRRASPAWCEEIHNAGFEVGIWLLRTEEELRTARNLCGADIIETDGSIKP